MNQEFNSFFTSRSIVSSRHDRKTSSYLVIAKPESLGRAVGSNKCDKSRCEVCRNNKETDTFTSTKTAKNFKISHKVNCYDNCLIYFLSCKCCGKQYVGKRLLNSGLDGITTKAMIEKMQGMKHVCKNIFGRILKVKVITVFLEMFR